MSFQSENYDATSALERATDLINRTMPDHAYRESALKIFARTIRYMHSRNPNCWSININDRHGPFLLIEHRYIVYCYGQTSEIVIHVYLKKAEESLITLLEDEAKLTIDKKDQWSLVTIHLPEQEDLFEKIWPLLQEYIDDKSQHDIHSLSIPTHLQTGAGVVEYIRTHNIDSTLPQPGYVPKSRSRKQDPSTDDHTTLTLTNLIEAFANEHLSFTPWQISTFYTALQTKGFVILSGISGMGKTKLAQAFARLLPQPPSRSVIPDDLIQIIVQPYMLKYNRIIIPKSSVEFFTPPEAGESYQVKVHFANQSDSCMLKHYRYSNTDYIQLYLKTKGKQWVEENVPPNSTLILEPTLNEDGKVLEFRMGKVEDFVKPIPVEASGKPDNILFLSVRPDWRDSKSLLGYFNPIDQQYNSTPFLEFIKRACQSYELKEPLAWFVVLDEMNLARVEYYFSDLLSVLESGRDNEGWTREPIRLELPAGLDNARYEREIHLPPNLYFIGTVNVDETTHAFSPKVLDRAFTIELTDPDFSSYPIQPGETYEGLSTTQRETLLTNFTREGRFAQIEKTEIYDYLNMSPYLRLQLDNLNNRLQPYDLHFGYRVLDEIAEFLVNAESNGFYKEIGTNDDPLDSAVLMKVLPKLHGSRTKLEEPLKEILSWCLKPDTNDNNEVETVFQQEANSINNLILKLRSLPYQSPHTANRVIRMIRSLYTTGFTSFG